MSHSCFTVREQVAPTQLAESIRVLSYQSFSLSQAINETLVHHENLHDHATFECVCWLIWLLMDTLEQQRALCERLEGRV